MSDVARFLPLSQRGAEDESRVSNDWSAHLAATLTRLADALAVADPQALEAPAAQTGYRVRDTIGHLLWMLQGSRAARLRALTATSLAQRVSRSQALLLASRQQGVGTRENLVAQLRSAALPVPGRRRSITDLESVVVDAYDTAASVPFSLEVDPIASGAVALSRSLRAPIAVRAVLSGRCLHAVDADWRVGHGVTHPAAAAGIILFLWERGPVPTAIATPEPGAGPASE